MDLKKVLETETSFMTTRIEHDSAPGGLLFDDKDPGQRAFSHWTLWTASFMTDTETRHDLIHAVHTHSANNATTLIPGTGYIAENGSRGGGEVAITLGGHYAPMAYRLPALVKTPAESESPDAGPDAPDGSANEDDHSHHSSTGTIAGAVVGGVAALVLLALAVFFFRRRRQSQRQGISLPEKDTPNTTPQHLTPYEYAPSTAPEQAPLAQGLGGRKARPAPNRVAAPPVDSTPGYFSSKRRRRDGFNANTPPPQAASQQTGEGSSDGDFRAQIERLQRDVQEMREAGGVEALPRYED